MLPAFQGRVIPGSAVQQTSIREVQGPVLVLQLKAGLPLRKGHIQDLLREIILQVIPGQNLQQLLIITGKLTRGIQTEVQLLRE